MIGAQSPQQPKGTDLFHNARGDLMTRFGFKYILAKHLRTASAKQPSLGKNVSVRRNHLEASGDGC